MPQIQLIICDEMLIRSIEKELAERKALVQRIESLFEKMHQEIIQPFNGLVTRSRRLFPTENYTGLVALEVQLAIQDVKSKIFPLQCLYRL